MMKKTIHRWKNLSVIEEEITLPNGINTQHTSIDHPGAVVILARQDDGNILLLNQYRPSIKSWLLEIPAGTLESGETPIQGAQRELEEETGYLAKNWTKLGLLTPMAGFCNEVQYLFLAEGLLPSHQRNCDEDEVIEVQSVSVDQLLHWIQSEKISDAKTIATLSKAMLSGHIK